MGYIFANLCNVNYVSLYRACLQKVSLQLGIITFKIDK